jgi:hypothetical protein
MASPTTPMHGKYGALYVYRPNGFKGIGLNDVTWGTGSTAADLTYYEVVIDGVGTGIGSVDEFKWRVNGGAWTEHVDITGSAQTLADGQTITFAATTGHTATDQWIIGNLKDEPCTESTIYGQITDATARLLNPNSPPTFTDGGGQKVLWINHTNGRATFSGNVGSVTVTGNNGYVPAIALQKVGYLIDWSLSVSLDMADSTAQGDAWKSSVVGGISGSGTAGAYFIGNQTLYKCLANSIANGEKYFLLELFNFDPDADQTGDHIIAWVTFTSFALNPTIGEVVKESVNYQIYGEISFISNV